MNWPLKKYRHPINVNTFEHADEAGMKYYIVEVEEYERTPLEDVKASYDYLMNADFVKR